MDITALSAARTYAEARPATQADPGSGATAAARALGQDFATTLAQSESLARQAMVGDADPHALVTALAQTELVVETAVSIRNRVVEAYQEILRMPV